ncbi:MAG: hypothetical protein FJX80_05925 [Bacteroidetes bacterium]|nr:hypothetical protein [Bacteroidota bacterium]
MKKEHFGQDTNFESSKTIDWDKGPWGGMSPKKDYSKFEIFFHENGDFELIINHKHTEDNIDHGERNYNQHSSFTGQYIIEVDNNDLLKVKLNINQEIKIIKECTNFDFIQKQEINHNLIITFSKKGKDEFSFSESDIFTYEGGYYGSFLFMLLSFD